MKSAGLAAAICLSILGLSFPQSAHAAEALLDAQDRAGDVRTYGNDGLRERDRRSIDLRRAWVNEVDNNTYRVSVKLKRVAGRSTRWDQMVFFHARPKNKQSDQYADIEFTHKPGSDAHAYDSRANESCELGAVKRKPAKGILSITVPLRCMPWDGWVMDATTITGTFRSDAPVFSRDRVAMGRFYYP